MLYPDRPCGALVIMIVYMFKKFLDQLGTIHIVARVKHPWTNGKIELFIGEVERRINKLGSIDKIVHWHNVIKSHMSLDYDEPCNVFWYRLGTDCPQRGPCPVRKNGYMCKINSGYHNLNLFRKYF